MPQQGLSIGRDITIVMIRNDTGAAIRFGKIMSFDPKQEVNKQKINPLDGSTLNLRYYQGWMATVRCERTGPELDTFFAESEAAYYAGQDQIETTMIVTIKEPDGSSSQWRYEQCVPDFDDPGSWASDKTVNQSVAVQAARRFQQA